MKRLLVLTLVVTLLVAAFGISSPKTSVAADKPVLVVSTWGYNQDLLDKNITEPFQDMYDVEIVYETGNNSERLSKLIERGERDRQAGPCVVEFQQGAKVDKRECTVLTVKHEDRQPHYDFYLAQIFIDNEMNIPVRYCAYDWPAPTGGDPVLLEEYTYTKIKTNVGLTDADFDSKNPKYRF